METRHHKVDRTASKPGQLNATFRTPTRLYTGPVLFLTHYKLQEKN